MRFFLAQLLFPAEDSRLVDGGFRFGDHSFLMQSDGQRGERKRVVGFELGESLAASHRFVKAVQLLQRARESMQGFRVCGIQGEALIVFRNRFFILAFRKQIETSLEMCLCTFAVRSHLPSLSMMVGARRGCPDSGSHAPQMLFATLQRACSGRMTVIMRQIQSDAASRTFVTIWDIVSISSFPKVGWTRKARLVSASSRQTVSRAAGREAANACSR